jgi:prepilin-type N-terminal cleavage/methylation domain-containing protein/prepilin-type processing-associated H-X9-DG protein
MSSMHRRGFTIVELMMVILILALLTALLTNAVQSSRETARRTQCLNKMREVGQAVIKYETDHNGYPGWVHPVVVAPPPQPKRLTSWIYQILPSLGRNDLPGSLGLDSSGNPVPLNDLLVCPSDPDKMAMRSPRSPTSIVCNAGRQDATATTPADWRSNGVFMNRDEAGVKVDVTDASFIAKGDGLANTLLLSESADAGSWYNPPPPPPPVNFPSPDETVSCIVFWPPPVLDIHRINGPRAGATAYDLARPSSYHPSGVNMFFCDGHGRFVRDSIDYWVYCALMTPRGGNAMEPGTTNPSAPQITNQPQITEAALQ